MPYKYRGNIEMTEETKEKLRGFKEEHQTWDEFFKLVLLLIQEDIARG